MFPFTTPILIVDDMAVMRTRLTKNFKSFGFTDITQAPHGKKALEMISERYKTGNPYKLIVSDWDMPEMTGIELLTALRGQFQYKDLPFLMVTAEGEEGHVIQAIKSGVSDYVIKPATQDDLKSKLERVWKKHNKSE